MNPPAWRPCPEHYLPEADLILYHVDNILCCPKSPRRLRRHQLHDCSHAVIVISIFIKFNDAMIPLNANFNFHGLLLVAAIISASLTEIRHR